MSLLGNPASNTDDLYRQVADFAMAELRPDVIACDLEGISSASAWCAAAAFGLHERLVPPEGGTLDLATIVAVMEAIGEGCEDGGFCLSLVAHAFGCAFPVHRGGAASLREAVLSAFRAGERIGACAMTETVSGSDAFSLQTSARKEGDAYVLDGDKSYVTNGLTADLFLVYARTDMRRGPLSISAFLVDRNSPGLEIEPGPAKVGVRTVDWARLRLNGCRVPEEWRVGAEGAGGALFMEAMKWERMALAAASVGAMRASLNRCVGFVKDHRRFDATLSDFQALKHRIVDMRVRLELVQTLLRDTACDLKAGSPKHERVAMVKIAVGEAAFQNGYDEARLHGAAGISMETGANLLLRNALALQTASGTTDIQKEFVARAMGLR